MESGVEVDLNNNNQCQKVYDFIDQGRWGSHLARTKKVSASKNLCEIVYYVLPIAYLFIDNNSVSCSEPHNTSV
ncbi:MAG: hypothetical protein WAK50_01180 [Nitrososphaeraceae archaeon]